MTAEISEQGHTDESIASLADSVLALARIIQGRERIVDEYLTQSLAPDSLSSIELQPQFQKLFECIEHIIIVGPATGNAVTQEIQGQVTSPGAVGQIASIVAANLVPGLTYLVTWTVELDGTVSATDLDNFRLRFGATTLLNSANDAAIGRYPQPNVELIEPSPATSINVVSIAAGTVGAIYTAQITAQPVTTYNVNLQLGDRYWANLAIPPTGVLEISPKKLLLGPMDRRILTANIAGQYTLELLGHADVRN